MKRMMIYLLATALLAACARHEEEPPLGIDPSLYNRAEVEVVLQLSDGQANDSQTSGGQSPQAAHAAPGDADALSRAAEPSRPGSAGADSTSVSVHCAAQGWAAGQAPQEAQTRSTTSGTVNETLIRDVWALQFDMKGNLVGKPVYKAGLESVSSTKLMLTATNGKTHTVWLVANTARADLFTVQNVLTIKRFEEFVHAFSGEADVTAGGVLLMSGSYTGTITDGQTLPAVAMLRAVSKLTVAYDTDRFEGGSVKVISVCLKNVPTFTRYVPHDASVAAYPAGTSSSHANYTAETTPGPAAGNYTWYLPENFRGSNPGVLYDYLKTPGRVPAGEGPYATFVEIVAVVTGTDGTVKTYMYILYPGATLPEYGLRRNGSYTMTVSLTGADTGDERVQEYKGTPLLDPALTFTEIMGKSITANGTILSDGGSPVTSAGVYFSTTSGFEPGDPGVLKAATTEFLSAFSYASACAAKGPLVLRSAAGTPSFQPPLAVAASGGALRAAPGVGTPFSVLMDDLTGNTTYYVRPFAENESGMSVGEQSTTATNDQPTIHTGAYDQLTHNHVRLAYDIKDPGLVTITDQGIQCSATGTIATGTKWSGASPVELTTLTPNLTYQYRAYMITADGTTHYGKTERFTTLQEPRFSSGPRVDYIPQEPGVRLRVFGNTAFVPQGTVVESGFKYAKAGGAETAVPAVAHDFSGVPGLVADWTWLGDAEHVDIDLGGYLRLYATTDLGVTFDSRSLPLSDLPGAPPAPHLAHVTGAGHNPGVYLTEFSGSHSAAWKTTANFTPWTSDYGGDAEKLTLSGSLATKITDAPPVYIRNVTRTETSDKSLYWHWSREAATTELPYSSAPELSLVQSTSLSVSVLDVTAGTGTVTARSIKYAPSPLWNPVTEPRQDGISFTEYYEAAATPSQASGTDPYTIPLTGLSDGVTYYFRAGATNSSGHAYWSPVVSVDLPWKSWQSYTADANGTERLEVFATDATATWNAYAPVALGGSLYKMSGFGSDESQCPAGWRLPLKKDMFLLIGVSRALDPAFKASTTSDAYMFYDPDNSTVYMYKTREGSIGLSNAVTARYIRCVRDNRNPASPSTLYPYVSGNTIVMRDASGGIAANKLTGVGSTRPSAADYVAAKFEVAAADATVSATYTAWSSGGSGADGSHCPAGWRLPSRMEWFLIQYFKDQMSVNPFEEERYWSCVSNSGRRFCFYPGDQTRNTYVSEGQTAAVRCVRDVN